jgi:hypothetical protein
MGTYPRAMTPEQVQTFVNEEQAKWAPAVQRLSSQ